jgi:hypothetical protein
MVLRYFIPILSALLIESCAYSGRLISYNDNTALETEYLKKWSEQNQIVSPERLKADSMVVVARQLKFKGKDKDAFYMLQLATSYYKLAISKYELEATETKIQDLEKNLSQAKEELKTYKDLVTELENIEQNVQKR